MRVSALQVNGEMICLQVLPEMTGRELKQQVKEVQLSDEGTRRTTGVEILIGDRLLDNDELVGDAGLAPDTVVSVVFKPNFVRCSNTRAIANFDSEMDLNLLLAVEIPDGEIQISEKAFQHCEQLAKLTIPNSVTRIGNYAFERCTSLVNLAIPNSVTRIDLCAFASCSSLGFASCCSFCVGCCFCRGKCVCHLSGYAVATLAAHSTNWAKHDVEGDTRSGQCL